MPAAAITRTPANSLIYDSADTAVFGSACKPVTCGQEVVIGGGAVLPEVNFTLPPMELSESNLPAVRKRFADMTGRVLDRAVALGQDSLVLEFEQLYELTRNPQWGAAITADIKAVMDERHAAAGIRTALRVTVADTREQDRPPRMRTGQQLQAMRQAFDLCAAAGADILSIESTGGKELSDPALLQGDLPAIVYALGVLAHRDMEFLWGLIVDIASRHGVVPGGDTACGFANTAMQLAHQRMVPKVLAAVLRLIVAPRSLVAVEMGARGPLKDCGYENPVIKFITGVPVSMEGKSSACAHSSPIGNIAACVCDLWSNESVQDTRLLGGYAPEVFTEVLTYDCRLMNTALQAGHAPLLRDLMARSDELADVQALVMSPAVMHGAARRIVAAGPDGYARTCAVTRYAIEVIAAARDDKRITLPPAEQRWFARLEKAVESLPDDPDELRQEVEANYPGVFLPAEYDL
jgi:methanol--5-hydroxybenzimidazolylcobamide Co-methyltransferase